MKGLQYPEAMVAHAACTVHKPDAWVLGWSMVGGMEECDISYTIQQVIALWLYHRVVLTLWLHNVHNGLDMTLY